MAGAAEDKTAQAAVEGTSRPDIQLSISHLGYLPSSPKTVTLVGAGAKEMPERIPFYIRQNCFNMPRDQRKPDESPAKLPRIYDLLRGKLIPREGSYYYKGELQRVDVPRTSPGACRPAFFK